MRRRKRANRQPTDAELIWRIVHDAADARSRHDVPRLKLAALHMRLAVERRSKGLAERARLREQHLARQKNDAEERRIIEELSRNLAILGREHQRRNARANGIPI